MRLEASLAGALVDAQDQVTLPHSVQGIAELFGVGARGTTLLSNALYEMGVFRGKPESARRNVERWIKTEKGDTGTNARHPSAQAREALDALAASRVDRATIRAIKRDGVAIHFSGEVTVSPDAKRPDVRDRDIDMSMSGDEAAAFLDKLIARDLSGAADEFNAAFFQAYGIGQSAVIGDVEDLSFIIGSDNAPF